jgi:outer membrane protein OmpA-like peptidoglycan-associated protein
MDRSCPVRIFLGASLVGLLAGPTTLRAEQPLEPTETGESGLMTLPTTKTLPPRMFSLGFYYRTEVGSGSTFETVLGQGRETSLTHYEFVGTVGVLADPGVEISLQVPYLSFDNEQRGPGGPGAPTVENTTDRVGDVRLGPKFRLFQEGHSPMPFSLAISGQVQLPTGSDQLPAQLDRTTALNGDNVGGDVLAVIDKDLFKLPGDVPVTLTLNIGGLFPSKPDVFRLDRQTEPVLAQLRRKGFPNVNMHSAVVEFGAGVNVPLWVSHIGTLDSTAEYRGNTGTIQQVDEYQAVLAGFRYTLVKGFAVHAGVDFGLTNSVPGYSVVAGISYSGLQPPPTYAEPGKEKVVYRDRVIYVERIAFPDINFQFDKATLTDVGRGRCYLIAQKLKDGKNVKIEIQGHTDYIGTEDYNKKLGVQRAEVVKAELVRLGIDPARISTVSFGEDKSLIDDQTPWGRAVGRRTGFVVIGEPKAPSVSEGTSSSEPVPAKAP